MPKLLLGDEPTGEMDTTTALAIYQLLRDLNQRYNLTTCIVSHDPTIARHVDRVVAIRDGKTATETIRQSVAAAPAEDGAESAVPQEDIYHELVVLDTAGRLQVPKDYLEQFGIRGRAQLEITEDGILIRPAQVVQEAQAAATERGETEAAATRISLRKRLQTVGSTLGRLTRREGSAAGAREGHDGN